MGKEALLAESQRHHNTAVHLIWNKEDILKVQAAVMDPEKRVDYMDMVGDYDFKNNCSTIHMDAVYDGEKLIGASSDRMLSAKTREMISICTIDEDYAVDTRAVIQVETNGQPLQGYNCALNDVAILKRDNASMIAIRTTINGEMLTTYQADGLIVSTPTGSTAYSLSVGGPIIVPGTHVFSLTAVAPHSLNVRPIVIGEDSVIELSVESRTQNYLVALDGRSEKLPDTTTLTLRRAPYRVQVIKRAGTKYFHTLREKMMWGADQRG